MVLQEIASLSVEPCEGVDITVAIFDIPKHPDTMEALQEREEEFELVLTPFVEESGKTGKVCEVASCANSVCAGAECRLPIDVGMDVSLFY